MIRLATILARAGSKGLAGKNVRTFDGETLLARAVRQARTCGVFDLVAVSSDSEAYLDIGLQAGADEAIVRPDALANDTVSKLPGIRHATETVEARRGCSVDVIADLAVTSPLRSDQDVREAVRLLDQSGAPLVLSACIARDNPYFNIVEQNKEGHLVLSKQVPGGIRARQLAPACHALNGAIYVWSRAELALPLEDVVRPKAQLYVMPPDRGIDIDDDFDLTLAAALLTLHGGAPCQSDEHPEVHAP